MGTIQPRMRRRNCVYLVREFRLLCLSRVYTVDKLRGKQDLPIERVLWQVFLERFVQKLRVTTITSVQSDIDISFFFFSFVFVPCSCFLKSVSRPVTSKTVTSKTRGEEKNREKSKRNVTLEGSNIKIIILRIVPGRMYDGSWFLRPAPQGS